MNKCESCIGKVCQKAIAAINYRGFDWGLFVQPVKPTAVIRSVKERPADDIAFSDIRVSCSGGGFLSRSFDDTDTIYLDI